jgi:hypothetical protein
MDIVYKRKNGENITYDPQAIESCKNEQSRDVIDNARLGSYDKFGNYIIIPDIKRELVSMPKLVYNVKTDANRTVYELKGSIPLFGDLYFKLVFAGEEAVLKSLEIASDLRSEGYSVSVDTVGRSIKAQMKYSNKIGAEYTVVLGDNELAENKAKLKNMNDGTETEISLDSFSEEFFQAVVKDSMNGIADASFSGMNPEDLNNLFKL